MMDLHSRMKKIFVKLLGFLSKHRIFFSCLCVLTFIPIVLYQNWYHSENESANPNESLAYECCIPLNNTIRTNVFLIKTHKTASSTIQSILLRFAKINSLDVMDIKYNSYYWPLSDSSIYRTSWTPNGKYHILAQHIRYDSKLKSYQYPNTSMVTILRHPARLFQSIYTYFKMDDKMAITFQQFLRLPNKPSILEAIDSSVAYRGYNQMSVDLGFDIEQRYNDTAVDEFIEKIDRDFDLVMITEYLEESMILFANLMGWPLEHVAHLHLNAKPPGYESYKLTLQDEDILMELNQVDSLLYHYFFTKFRKCVRQYGEDKMNRQVEQLRIINMRLKERCVAKEVVANLYGGQVKTMMHISKNLSDLECLYSTTPDYGLNIPPELLQIVYG